MPKHASPFPPSPVQTTHPLPEHRQLAVITTAYTTSPNSPNHVEFRAYNYRRLRSGRVARGDGWGLIDLLLVMISLWAIHGTKNVWPTFDGNLRQTLPRIIVAIFFMVLKTRTVLYQSVTPLPSLGLQLSTVRGISLPRPSALLSSRLDRADRLLVPLLTSHAFIPLSDIGTVIINEGLTRWSATFYLAVVLKRGQGITVAFDSIRAPHPVLLEVYQGVREILFDECDDNSEPDE